MAAVAPKTIDADTDEALELFAKGDFQGFVDVADLTVKFNPNHDELGRFASGSGGGGGTHSAGRSRTAGVGPSGDAGGKAKKPKGGGKPAAAPAASPVAASPAAANPQSAEAAGKAAAERGKEFESAWGRANDSMADAIDSQMDVLKGRDTSPEKRTETARLFRQASERQLEASKIAEEAARLYAEAGDKARAARHRAGAIDLRNFAKQNIATAEEHERAAAAAQKK